MKPYRIKVRQVYIETMFVEAETEDDFRREKRGGFG